MRHPGLPGGLILCHTAPTLAPLPDDNPPPSLADRAGPDAQEVAARLFGGDMSPVTLEAFGRLVWPFYAAPGHMDVPARLLALSAFQADVARYFFGTLAPTYDVRARLGEITIPTLVLAGRYDWVCPPAASRTITDGIPGAELVELADAGHFGFSEEPARFHDAVRGVPRPDRVPAAGIDARLGALPLLRPRPRPCHAAGHHSDKPQERERQPVGLDLPGGGPEERLPVVR